MLCCPSAISQCVKQKVQKQSLTERKRKKDQPQGQKFLSWRFPCQWIHSIMGSGCFALYAILKVLPVVVRRGHPFVFFTVSIPSVASCSVVFVHHFTLNRRQRILVTKVKCCHSWHCLHFPDHTSFQVFFQFLHGPVFSLPLRFLFRHACLGIINRWFQMGRCICYKERNN